MEKGDKQIDFFLLIPKYLSGNASDEEVRLLEEWVLASPENKAQFNAFRKAWILSHVEGNDQQIDLDEEWRSVSRQLFPKDKVVPLPGAKNRRWHYLSIAAALMLLLAASIWIIPTLLGESPMELATNDQVEQRALPDGSQISLNQFSSIRYVPAQDQNIRQVILEGDAFFEVERDIQRPFLINTQNVEIEVLGTSFYIDSREAQEQVQVIVASGSVAVRVGSQQITLSENQIGIYDKSSGTLTSRQNDDLNYLAWKTEVLRFEETELEKVVFDLNRMFHVDISIANEAIRSCPISTTFDHKSLDTIISIIEKTLNIQSEKTGEEIIFSGQSCE